MAVDQIIRATASSVARMGDSPVDLVVAGLATFGLLRRWTDWMEVSGRYSVTTRRQYRRYVLGFLADTLIPLEDLTEDDVVAYLATLPAKGDMRGAVLRSLRCFYRYAEREMPNPVERLKVPRKKYGPAAYLNDADLEAVLTASERLDPRARPTLEFMFGTGARLGSIVGVTSDDLDLEGRLVHFRIAKGDRPYSVPLGPRAEAAARELLRLSDWQPKMASHRRPTLVGVGAGTVQRWISEAGQIAGVHAYSHLLRHSFAERLCNDPTVPALAVAELLNHADTALLRRYATARMPVKRAAVSGL